MAQVYALLWGPPRGGDRDPRRAAADVRVRDRVEGRLVERGRLPRSLLGPVVSRFRILAGLRGESLPRQRTSGRDSSSRRSSWRSCSSRRSRGSGDRQDLRRARGLPTLESFDLDGDTRATLLRLTGGAGLVFVTGWESRARAALLYALAQAAAAPAKKA